MIHHDADSTAESVPSIALALNSTAAGPLICSGASFFQFSHGDKP
jgi:hypothetical protein